MSSTLHPMLNVAIKAARAAGSIINRAALDVEAVRVSQKQVNDFVTEVDQAAEDAIISTILEAYPGHGILAEESGTTHGKASSTGGILNWLPARSRVLSFSTSSSRRYRQSNLQKTMSGVGLDGVVGATKPQFP